MNTSDRLRGLESTSFYLLIMEKKSPIIQAGEAAYQSYLAAMDAMEASEKASHSRGPPHIHIFQAILKALTAEEIEYKPAMTPIKDAAKNFLIEMDKMDLDAACDAIRHCKFQKAYESSQIKIQFAAQAAVKVEPNIKTTIGSVVSRLLVSQIATRKYGKAPPGWMERELNKVLAQQRKK